MPESERGAGLAWPAVLLTCVRWLPHLQGCRLRWQRRGWTPPTPAPPSRWVHACRAAALGLGPRTPQRPACARLSPTLTPCASPPPHSCPSLAPPRLHAPSPSTGGDGHHGRSDHVRHLPPGAGPAGRGAARRLRHPTCISHAHSPTRAACRPVLSQPVERLFSPALCTSPFYSKRLLRLLFRFAVEPRASGLQPFLGLLAPLFQWTTPVTLPNHPSSVWHPALSQCELHSLVCNQPGWSAGARAAAGAASSATPSPRPARAPRCSGRGPGPARGARQPCC